MRVYIIRLFILGVLSYIIYKYFKKHPTPLQNLNSDPHPAQYPNSSSSNEVSSKENDGTAQYQTRDPSGGHEFSTSSDGQVSSKCNDHPLQRVVNTSVLDGTFNK